VKLSIAKVVGYIADSNQSAINRCTATHVPCRITQCYTALSCTRHTWYSSRNTQVPNACR